MTSRSHKLAHVCLAVISLTAFSHIILKHKIIVTWNISGENIRQYFHFLRSCSHLFTFHISSHCYWHIRSKSTACFLIHPVYATMQQAGEFLKSILRPDSCLHCLLPAPRDKDLTAKLRVPPKISSPAGLPYTKRFQSLINLGFSWIISNFHFELAYCTLFIMFQTVF